jgi:hypothetical protein
MSVVVYTLLLVKKQLLFHCLIDNLEIMPVCKETQMMVVNIFLQKNRNVMGICSFGVEKGNKACIKQA